MGDFSLWPRRKRFTSLCERRRLAGFFVILAATNRLMSKRGVRILPGLVGSILGLAPRVIAVVWIGASLTELGGGTEPGSSPHT